jgi:hypothetical protein
VETVGDARQGCGGWRVGSEEIQPSAEWYALRAG